MEVCKVVAEVMIETASHPATPWYLCSYSGANPLVCTTSASYSALLRDPAFKELNKVAAEKGCTVAVQVGDEVCRIVIVEGAETVRDLDRALEHGKQTYRALNTANGIVWLMRYLSLR